MHYWKVPRLGSYMAIPLVYKSALSVSSFEEAYEAHNVYTGKVQAQEREKQEWQERVDAMK